MLIAIDIHSLRRARRHPAHLGSSIIRSQPTLPWLTLPNALSTSRLLLAPLGAVLVMRQPLAQTTLLAGTALCAAAVFYIAVATDVLDGRIARRRGQVSALGGLLDHGSDAVFVTVLLGALAWIGVVPALLPPLVIAAFTQYMLDSKALAGHTLRASWLGRRNGVAYFVLAGTAITRDALQFSWPANSWLQALGWLLIATTLLSMYDRAATLYRTRGNRSSV